MYKIVLMAFIAFFCGSGVSYADIPDNLAIKALVGEAGGQSDMELYAHACALLNRGDLKGVYGLKADISKRGEKALQRASNQWRKAKTGVDITKGCTHWLSDYDLKHCRESLIAWRHKAIYSIKIGETTFYKLK